MLAVIVGSRSSCCRNRRSPQGGHGVYDRVDAAGVAVGRIITGITPGGLDDGQRLHPRRRRTTAPATRSAAAILLCELDGTAEEVAEDLARVEALMRDAGANATSVFRRAEERLRQNWGPGARRRSRRSGASRQFTTAWTARSRA